MPYWESQTKETATKRYNKNGEHNKANVMPSGTHTMEYNEENCAQWPRTLMPMNDGHEYIEHAYVGNTATKFTIMLQQTAEIYRQTTYIINSIGIKCITFSLVRFHSHATTRRAVCDLNYSKANRAKERNALNIEIKLNTLRCALGTTALFAMASSLSYTDAWRFSISPVKKEFLIWIHWMVWRGEQETHHGVMQLIWANLKTVYNSTTYFLALSIDTGQC